ncbi:hypothetical protein MLD52_06755 [Puniceicoccaceae bacterium K14]|nr:hypothetical protein [Puniceicoccaceae bacterium K14]
MKHLLPIILAILLSGCAVRYTGSNGHLNTIGLTWTKVSKPQSVDGTDADETKPKIKIGPTKVTPTDRETTVVQTQSIGAKIELTGRRTGVSIGYSETIDIYPERDSITTVKLDSNDPMKAESKVTELDYEHESKIKQPVHYVETDASKKEGY